MTYPIKNVDNWIDVYYDYPDYIGNSEKYWLKNPSVDDEVAMFKIPRENRGEHWAEKICYEFAKVLDIPCARVDLASCENKYGSISYYFVDKRNGYVHYDSSSFFDYDLDEKDRARNYTIEFLEELLESVGLFEALIPILVFDALVANGDRHQDNWGITKHEATAQLKISPLYDNSASLCREQNDVQVNELLQSKQNLLKYIYKGNAKVGLRNKKNANHFSVIQYLISKYPQVTKTHIENIKNKLTDKVIQEIVDEVPSEIMNSQMKELVKQFVSYRREILIRIGDNMIHNINELLLIWKDPISRRRFVVGELKYNVSNQIYSFEYAEKEVLEIAIKEGFTSYPKFNDLKKVYESNTLFGNIKSRLPNSKRPNYAEILARYGATKDNTEMELLQVTRGRLATDNFEFVMYVEYISGNPFNVSMDIAGARHKEFTSVARKLSIGESVILLRDLENEFDEYAVMIMHKDNICLGFVPRYISGEIRKMLDEEVEYLAKISKLDIDNESSDEWASIQVQVVFNGE